MKISQAYPSKYLRSSDIERPVVVTISHVLIEEVDEQSHDRKPAMYFQGAQKGMVINRTNGDELAMLFGDETDNWAGRQIEIYVANTMYMGKPTQGLRVRAPSQQQAVAAQQAPAQQQAVAQPAPVDTHPNAPGGAADMDDPVSFAPHTVG